MKYDKIKLSQEKMKQKARETVLPPNHFLRPLEAAGTGGAQKCQGSGAPNPNRHQNQPLCHAMQAAACVFDVVVEALTVATKFMRLFKAGSDGLAWVLGAGAAGFCLLQVLVVLHVWAKYTLSQWRGLLAVGFL